MLQLELHLFLRSHNIILVTKATEMTKLTYRGVPYIKDDRAAQYSPELDRLAKSEPLRYRSKFYSRSIVA